MFWAPAKVQRVWALSKSFLIVLSAAHWCLLCFKRCILSYSERAGAALEEEEMQLKQCVRAYGNVLQINTMRGKLEFSFYTCGWSLILNGVALQCNKYNDGALFTRNPFIFWGNKCRILSLLQLVRSQEMRSLSVTRSLLLVFNYLQGGGLAHLPARAPL